MSYPTYIRNERGPEQGSLVEEIRHLAGRAAARDPVAFADLYRLYAPQILQYVASRVSGRQEAEGELGRTAALEADPEALVLADERRRRLREELLNLTEEQRQVLGCRFFFNLSVQEVAQAMGKTEGAVKALQFRALERLRRRLAPDWART